MYRLPLILVLIVVLFTTACQRTVPEYRETQYLFGTLVNFTLRGVEPAQAQAAVAAVGEDFQRMHNDWHAWKPGELSRLNQQLPDGEFHPVNPFLLPLIEQAGVLAAQSDDLFNPAIGQLVKLWGFHSDTLPSGPPPPGDVIQALVEKQPRMADLLIDGDRIRSRNPIVSLDFGGFAKGAALDLAMQRLRSMGIQNAIINAGGDLNVIGSHGERPWKVGVRHPQGEGVLAAVELADGEAIYTSGNYERYREHEGVSYSHIIDPRTGMPVHHVASVTVIDRVGARADAAATALSVAGPKDWYRVARQMGLKYVMLVDEQGRVHMNPAMAERVRFEVALPEPAVISDSL
ncbi:MAG: FAD:protein FMN transferase [Gammaproteobacteria bacterium]|nr:FAD:protein FMN transferase [Gammaproteobacteria bacterium]